MNKLQKTEREREGTVVLAVMKQSLENTETSLVIVNGKNSHPHRKLVQSFKVLFHSHREMGDFLQNPETKNKKKTRN